MKKQDLAKLAIAGILLASGQGYAEEKPKDAGSGDSLMLAACGGKCGGHRSAGCGGYQQNRGYYSCKSAYPQNDGYVAENDMSNMPQNPNQAPNMNYDVNANPNINQPSQLPNQKQGYQSGCHSTNGCQGSSGPRGY